MTKRKILLFKVKRFWSKLGPGLITGASDDEPIGHCNLFSGRGKIWSVFFMDSYHYISTNDLCPENVRPHWSCHFSWLNRNSQEKLSQKYFMADGII